MSCRSERVKAVDFHPTEPWVLSALYNGTVTIRNFQTNSLVKTIEVCDLPGKKRDLGLRGFVSLFAFNFQKFALLNLLQERIGLFVGRMIW